MGKKPTPAWAGSESLFVLTYLIDATLAQAETPLALGITAVFAEFKFLVHDPFPISWAKIDKAQV
jgi:hypothetical protein